MKTFKKYILGVALLSATALTGCEDKMRELNTDPDIISEALPEYQFLGATKNWGWFSNGWARSRANDIGAVMQVSCSGSNAPSYVNPSDWKGGGVSYMDSFWHRYYSSGKNFSTLVEYIDEDDDIDDEDRVLYGDIRAIALLMQTYSAWVVFDSFGSMVYSEAFQVTDGIGFPSYDIYNTETAIYKTLDEKIKSCIAQLAAPAVPEAVALGRYDGFYGFDVETQLEGGARFTVTSASDQRDNWLRFATTLRLKMALRWRTQDDSFYKTVLAEVQAQVLANSKSLMSEVAHGCQYYLQDAHYDRNENNQLAFWYAMPLSYINTMRQTTDPRLPLVAVPNDLDTTLSADYKFTATYYPEVLTNVWNKETWAFDGASWGDRFQLGNVFQGQTSNPQNFGKGKTFGAGTLNNAIGSPKFTIYHHLYQQLIEVPEKATDAEKEAIALLNEPIEKHNATLVSEDRLNVFTNAVENAVYPPIGKTPVTVAEGAKPFTGGKREVSFSVASGVQSRQYVKNGGSSRGWSGKWFDWDDDQPSTTDIILSTKVLSYSEHCFLMALICNYDGVSIGTMDAQGWYEEGIKASMQETNDDAERVYVKISTNVNFPIIANVNSDAKGQNKFLYKIDAQGGDVANYIAQDGIAFAGGGNAATEQIMIQMWLSQWQKPENFWGYYKLTGYPSSVDYDWMTLNQSDMPTTLGLEQPYNTDNNAMVWPRRVNPLKPQMENLPKWREMQSTLRTQQNPVYAPGDNWDNLSGRVDWDVAPASVLIP